MFVIGLIWCCEKPSVLSQSEPDTAWKFHELRLQSVSGGEQVVTRQERLATSVWIFLSTFLISLTDQTPDMTRLWLLGPLLLLALAALASASDKKKDALADKVSQLVDLSTKKSVIKLNGNKFRDFVKSAPRNYSIIVMFTALAANRQCAVCKQAADEYQLVANSYRYSQLFSNKLFFAMVDFDEGPDVFQSMKLNTAPVFMHFPAKGKPKKADNMDIQRVGFSAEAIAKWIGEVGDQNLLKVSR